MAEYDQQTEAMLKAERRAGHDIATRRELEVRLSILRASLERTRARMMIIADDIDGILGSAQQGEGETIPPAPREKLPDGWFRLSPYRTATSYGCASEGCLGHPQYRLEAGGVGSDYCENCAATIRAQQGEGES